MAVELKVLWLSVFVVFSFLPKMELYQQERRVLVMMGERNRPVSFRPDAQCASCVTALTAAVRSTFSDVLSPDQEIFFQLKSEEWDGVFVDICDGDVPDKSVLKAVPVRPSKEVSGKVSA